MEATFVVEKECKHSRRYKCIDPDFPIQSIYINRYFATDKDTIKLTIEEE